MKTVNIKGKEYVEVNERVKYFRENYTDWSIETELLSNENGVCVIKAIVKNPDGIVKATGHAYENEGSTFINKTSYIENCETSAVGRALGLLGIGIDTSIASSEEVQTAIKNQAPKEERITLNFRALEEKFSKMTTDELRREYVNVTTHKSLTREQKEKLTTMIKEAQSKLDESQE